MLHLRRNYIGVWALASTNIIFQKCYALPKTHAETGCGNDAKTFPVVEKFLFLWCDDQIASSYAQQQ